MVLTPLTWELAQLTPRRRPINPAEKFMRRHQPRSGEALIASAVGSEKAAEDMCGKCQWMRIHIDSDHQCVALENDSIMAGACAHCWATGPEEHCSFFGKPPLQCTQSPSKSNRLLPEMPTSARYRTPPMPGPKPLSSTGRKRSAEETVDGTSHDAGRKRRYAIPMSESATKPDSHRRKYQESSTDWLHQTWEDIRGMHNDELLAWCADIDCHMRLIQLFRSSQMWESKMDLRRFMDDTRRQPSDPTSRRAEHSGLGFIAVPRNINAGQTGAHSVGESPFRQNNLSFQECTDDKV